MTFDLEKYRSIGVNTSKDLWGTRTVWSNKAGKRVRDEAGNEVTTKDNSQDVQINASTIRVSTGLNKEQ